MKKIALVLLVILMAVALRFWGLGNIQKNYFDEVNFLYDAFKYQKGVLSIERESVSVPRHPLLSILFMQTGISLFGFKYLGWRIFSVVFGVLSVAALFFLARELFSFRAALLSSLLLSFNFLHIVLSRIAMAEIYLLSFLLFGFCCLARSLKYEDSRYLLLAGMFFGLSLATKWVALLSILSAWLIYILSSKDPRRHFKSLMHLILFPAAIFFLASLYLNLSAGMGLISWIQYELNNLRYFRLFSYIHPAHASAWGWPFLLKATPFYVADVGKEMVRAVIAFGNPAVYWVMLPVLVYLIYEFWKKRSPSLLFVLIGFLGAYLPWLLYNGLMKTPFIQERGMFFYYFMPAIPFYLMGLSHILDLCLKSRAGRIIVALYLVLIIGLFLFFSPLLYALPVSLSYFKKLIWLRGWI